MPGSLAITTMGSSAAKGRRPVVARGEVRYDGVKLRDCVLSSLGDRLVAAGMKLRAPGLASGCWRS